MKKQKIYLSTTVPDAKTAASKARLDVMAILDQAGYHTVYFPVIRTLGGLLSFWKALSRVTGRGSHIVLEYPCNPRKRIWLIALFCRLKGVKLYGIVHDIGYLRLPDISKDRDIMFLKLFDGLVSHNAKMSAWLREKGYGKALVDLEVFDYCLREPADFHQEQAGGKLKILYAGNLSFDKATYVYDEKLEGLQNIDLCLYGQNFEQSRINGSPVQYKGVFNPDHPSLPENYHFGLIWEGTSTETCAGQFGEYIKYNNPHKFSLYLALGLPVVVWEKAAVASFVREHDLGFTIGSLRELDQVAGGITTDTYQKYLANAEAESRKVRDGYFLRTAIEKLVKS